MGGATLAIESSQIHTLNRGFKLTGRLGDVMRESAEIAYSYVIAHLKDYGCDPDFFDMSMVHLHVPEGATPKDGPSAGITMATALVSLARKERIRRPLAMTGELTLTGRVLPVGGIKEKIIAAHRSKVKTVILPKENERACPGCGLTPADFKEHGRLGCPKCYETFEGKLSSVIHKLHRGDSHLGKVPNGKQLCVSPAEMADFVSPMLPAITEQ